jgi:hypothetical protein
MKFQQFSTMFLFLSLLLTLATAWPMPLGEAGIMGSIKQWNNNRKANNLGAKMHAYSNDKPMPKTLGDRLKSLLPQKKARFDPNASGLNINDPAGLLSSSTSSSASSSKSKKTQ